MGESGLLSDLAHLFPPLCPQKFLFFVLKSSDVLDILVPILYFLNDARADQCKAGVGMRSWGLPCRGAGPAGLCCLWGAQAGALTSQQGLLPGLPGWVPTLCGDFPLYHMLQLGWA